MQDVINTVHILPFYPYSSDDGFSIVNYKGVCPLKGSWKDIENIRTEKLKNALYGDLAKALDQYQIRTRLYRISSRRKEATQTTLQIVEEKFKNGTINSFDYRTVQNDNLSAGIQELQSLYNVIDAKVKLMRLTGGIIESYTE